MGWWMHENALTLSLMTIKKQIAFSMAMGFG